MKCPDCQINHTYSVGMRCRCGYRFVLDPKKHGISDSAWLALLKQASGDGTRWYTRQSLWAGQATRPRSSFWPFAAFMSVAGFLCFLWQPVFAIPAVIILIVGAILHLRPNRGLSWVTLGSIIDHWQKAGREMPNYIQRPSLTAPPGDTPTDVFDYGTERILVVDDPLLVDFIVLNGIHADERCAVIALNGYPEHLKSPIQSVIAARPDIPVFLLHAATEAGEAMAKSLPAWLSAATNVVDLGYSRANKYDIPALKKAQEIDKQTPLTPDLVGHAVMGSMLGLAFVEGLTMTQVQEQQAARGATDDGSSTGYG